MKKVKIKANKYLVLRKDGQPVFAKKMSKNMVVEAPDDMEVVEKTSLTTAEKKQEK